MKHDSRWAAIFGWTAAASVCTFLLWIPLAAVAGSIRSPMGAAGIPTAMFLYVLYTPFLAPVIVLSTALVYLPLFWLWGRVCARHPRFDRSWTAILAAAAIVSPPPALATALLFARVPSGVAYDVWLGWLPFCVVIWCGAILAPRWLFESLRPGVFSEPLWPA